MPLRVNWLRVMKMVVTGGIGVTVTGIFGIVVISMQGRDDRYRAVCAHAKDIVVDDTLNPALTRAISVQLTQQAADRLKRCFKDD